MSLCVSGNPYHPQVNSVQVLEGTLLIRRVVYYNNIFKEIKSFFFVQES
jgi:hypothetical protein